MPHHPYRLLIFDWDGTLIDSIGSIVDCVQETLLELGEMPADEEAIRSSIGLGLRETVEMFRPGCSDELFARVVEAYRRLWIERFSHDPPLFPGVVEMLERLAASGYLMAVATAKSRGGLEHDLKRTGLEAFFRATRTVDEAPSKPHPGMLLDILDELRLAAGVSLMIGDTVHDLAMAANAGMPAVAVLSGCESRETLEPWGPRECLATVTDLTAWLDGEPGNPAGP